MDTRIAAARALGQLASYFPASGLSLLPVLLFSIRRATDEVLGGLTAATGVLVASMEAMVPLAAHPMATGAVLRALQPLLAQAENTTSKSDLPAVLGSLGLRILTQVWAETGRGFAQLQAALTSIGSLRVSTLSPPLIRATRAACLLEVCQLAPDRALKLIHSVQDCLQDPDPR